MRISLAIAAVVTGLTACVSQPAKLAETRWPQVVVNAPKQQIYERFVGTLALAGATVESTNESLLQARIPDANAAWAKAFFGCPQCADPYLRTNVVFSTVGAGTQIVVQYWRVVPKATGSEDRMEIDSNNDFNQWQKILWNLRDQYQGASAASVVTPTLQSPQDNQAAGSTPDTRSRYLGKSEEEFLKELRSTGTPTP